VNGHGGAERHSRKNQTCSDCGILFRRRCNRQERCRRCSAARRREKARDRYRDARARFLNAIPAEQHHPLSTYVAAAFNGEAVAVRPWIRRGVSESAFRTSSRI
jgi:hypothetical protein